MNKQYTKSFKIEAVKKVLSRDSETTMKEIANSLNVKISTLHGWVKAAESQKLHENHDSGEKRPQDWTSLEKLTALIEADSLDPEAKSAYCREKGIFPHNLQEWKKNFTAQEKEKNAYSKKNLKVLKNENLRLKKELDKKEKALAEAAVLLILKKKAEKIWGKIEED